MFCWHQWLMDPETIGKEYSHIILGCSAWGVEVIEEEQMKPFCEKLKPFLKGKIMGIFGSCGWSRGAWLNSWYNELHFAGAVFPAQPLLAYGYPDKESLKSAKILVKGCRNPIICFRKRKRAAYGLE